MRVRKPSVPSIKLWSISGAVILLSAAGLAALWPACLGAARAESESLTREAAQANGGEAETDYRLALRLHPQNEVARLGLARTMLANGHVDEALQHLAKAGDSPEAQTLRIRTLLELGRLNEAANEATTLIAFAPSDEHLALAILAYTLADRTAPAQTLIQRVSSPALAQRLRRALTDKTTLGAELYATGLHISSSTLLVKLAPSPERNYLLARIHYDRHTAAALSQSADLLSTALALDPTRIATRELLITVYRDQHSDLAASQQAILLTKLQAGRP